MHDHPGAAEAATHETRAKFRSDGRQNEMTISPGTSEIRRLHGVSRSQNGNCGMARRFTRCLRRQQRTPAASRIGGGLWLLAHRGRSVRAAPGPPPRPNLEATANRVSDTSNPGSPVRATLKSAHTKVAYFPRRIVSSLRASDRALPGRCTAP